MEYYLLNNDNNDNDNDNKNNNDNDSNNNNNNNNNNDNDDDDDDDDDDTKIIPVKHCFAYSLRHTVIQITILDALYMFIYVCVCLCVYVRRDGLNSDRQQRFSLWTSHWLHTSHPNLTTNTVWKKIVSAVLPLPNNGVVTP